MAETIHIGIPAHDERDWLPHTLSDLSKQDDRDFRVWICVNQAATDASDPERAAVDRRNRETVAWLRDTTFSFPVALLVALDPGDAPSPEDAGVGWARRTLFEAICARAPDPAICVSLDADTRVGPEYVAAIREAFLRHQNAVALAVPYHHRVPEDDPSAARQILNYEIYLRYYQIGLWRIGSPYAFVPIGSGMAFRAGAYRRIGGIKARKAGEDFYFMQQLRKLGPVMRHVETRIEPSARRSDRNPFGTGVAVGSDPRLLRQRYPLYAQRSFDKLAAAFALFGELFRAEVSLPIDAFLEAHLGGRQPFARMRRNLPDRAHFVRACHERFDALRTLQFLRFDREDDPPSDTEALADLLAREGRPPPRIELEGAGLEALALVREELCLLESAYQRRHIAAWDRSARW